MFDLEIWFTNGEWRKFPSVEEDSVETDDGKTASFVFGEHKHKALVNMCNVNFMERIEEES